MWPLVVAPKPEFRLIQVAISLSVEEYRVLWNELLAGSMLAAIIPILLILPFQRYYVGGIAGTGIKE
jgi:ABC-type glycerol-3-phosphate transport system permease component